MAYLNAPVKWWMAGKQRIPKDISELLPFAFWDMEITAKSGWRQYVPNDKF